MRYFRLNKQARPDKTELAEMFGELRADVPVAAIYGADCGEWFKRHDGRLSLVFAWVINSIRESAC